MTKVFPTFLVALEANAVFVHGLAIPGERQVFVSDEWRMCRIVSNVLH